MSAAAPPGDAELVAGVLAGDREAFAQVYERYADRLYDFAYSMLRSREQAADCVADSFVVMAEKLGQLRDPASLRPWLYSVVRNECLRTLRGRAREAHDDEWLAAMPDASGGPEQQVEQAAVEDELRELVWAAVEGLNDRDRVLLDLHLRQGLEGAELATAMDVTAANAYVMLSRARDQVERSLGALLVARRGNRDCEPLAELLRDWDGRFSPLIRKRVARHIDGCDLCESRRRVLASPLALLAGVPAFAAPLSLRDRVLDDPRLVSHYVAHPSTGGARGAGGSGGSGGLGGFGGSGGIWRRGVLVAAVALLLVVGGWGVLAWSSGSGDDLVAADPATSVEPGPTTGLAEPTEVADPVTTSAPTGGATEQGSATPTDSPTATETTTATSARPTAPAAASLEASTRLVDLGARASSGSVRLRNTGGAALTLAVTPRAGWLGAEPGTRTLGPGAATTLRVTADRSVLPEGGHSGEVAVTWDGGTVLVTVRLTVDRLPVIGALAVRGTDCTSRAVSTTITDAQGVDAAQVSWSGPSGSGREPMARGGGRWRATIGPFPVGGSVRVTVTATDRGGHRSTRSRTVHVDPCPG
ncbi:sigma-70 family RNA polymerase sigma factor [Nocardioides sp. SYSU DS0651]|uniref:sigma-70 family RNA polymerase sigma factor n=1 Tax=Nocardioides sp. SYSU DS0651 TaxID=3415955 RepID=UPI003F4B71F9